MGALALYLDLMLDLLSLSLFSNGNQVKKTRRCGVYSASVQDRTVRSFTDGVREEVDVSDATHIKQIKRKSTKKQSD